MIYVPVTGTTDHNDVNGVPDEVGGTSFAAPQVKYLVDRIREKRPDLTPDQIRQILFDPTVAPLEPVHLPDPHGGVTMKVPVIKNPYDSEVLRKALAAADALFPPAGITVSPTSGLVTTEGGGKATFTVVLRSKPTANVTIGLSSSDTTEGRPSKSSLVFTPANWKVPQIVTVTGVDDSIVDGDQAYTIVTGPAVCKDPASVYNGLDPDDVNVTNKDNDESNSLSITLSPLSAQVVWQVGGFVDFEITVSGIVAGPVGTFLCNGVMSHTTIDSWTGAGNTRELGDPSSTHFSRVESRDYFVSELPLVYTTEVEVVSPNPPYVVTATASITLSYP